MPEPTDPEQLGRDLPIRVVAQGTYGPVEPGEYVYRDAEEWRAVQAGIRDAQYEPNVPAEGVLLASVHANSGGYSVTFDSVRVVAGEVVATYTVLEPGPGCMVTMALTQPFQAVAVPGLPDGAVVFVQRRNTYAC